MSADFFLAQGDTASPITRTATDANGNAVLIQGAGVKFNMFPIGGGTPAVNMATATNGDDGSPANKGKMTYGDASHPWGAASATPGDYLAIFQVTFGDGTIETFPNGGYLLVTVTADDPTANQWYLSAAELKRTMSMFTTTFADQDFNTAVLAAAQAIDNYCGRTFKPHQGATTTRYYTAIADEFVAIHDVQEKGTMTLTISGDASAVIDTDYFLDPVPVTITGPPYSALRKITRSFSRGSPNAVAVTAKWGWPAVPDAVTSACGIIASRLLRRQREAPFGILPFGDQGEAMRLTQADPDIKFLLQPYRRQDLFL